MPQIYRKKQLVSLRLSPMNVSLIDHSATLKGCSRSQFMRDAAIQAATQAILEQSLIMMSAEGFAAFQTMIDADAQVVPAIARLRTHQAPWQRLSTEESQTP